MQSTNKEVTICMKMGDNFVDSKIFWPNMDNTVKQTSRTDAQHTCVRAHIIVYADLNIYKNIKEEL